MVMGQGVEEAVDRNGDPAQYVEGNECPHDGAERGTVVAVMNKRSVAEEMMVLVEEQEGTGDSSNQTNFVFGSPSLA